jgi:hypothetical protein
MQYSSYFSLPPLYLTLACSGEEGGLCKILKLWKKVQREIQKHQFITEYIVAYIQGLCKGAWVHPTGLTVNQGCSQQEERTKVQFLRRWPLTVREPLLWRLGWRCRSRACKKLVCDRKNNSWTVDWRHLRRRRRRNQRVWILGPLGGGRNAWALA